MIIIYFFISCFVLPHIIRLWVVCSSAKKDATLQVCTDSLSIWITCYIVQPIEVFLAPWLADNLFLNLCPIVWGSLPELGTHWRKGYSSVLKYHLMSSSLYSCMVWVKEQVRSTQGLASWWISSTAGPVTETSDRQSWPGVYQQLDQ